MRLAVARALYAGARLLALDEPLGALDAALARHVVARALVPAARRGAAVLLATNRLELLHYADLVRSFDALSEGYVKCEHEHLALNFGFKFLKLLFDHNPAVMIGRHSVNFSNVLVVIN